MIMSMLVEFLLDNRQEILARARLRVNERMVPVATASELSHGLPLFLDQLVEALRRESDLHVVDHDAIQRSARRHGRDLFNRGLTVAQVVHDYGDICQIVTGLVVEKRVPIAADEFQTLNLCLDDAIAGAVTEYAKHREQSIADEGAERLGILAHEMRNLLNAAVISFTLIKKGTVAPAGSTSAVHDRSLLGLQRLIDRSLADVRLDAGILNVERVAVCEVLEEVEVGVTLLAQHRGIRFAVTTVDATVVVEADRQVLAAAIVNLLQNAFKFTRPESTVSLTASATATRVHIDIEDECGGLPSGKIEDLLQPFKQKGSDRTGLGLGLSICLKAVKAMSGELRIRDLPGKGCVFTIDLPKQLPPPTSIYAHNQGANGGPLKRAGGPA
jgi:hypothetical protein